MRRLAREEVVEEVEFLTSWGITPERIVRRLDSTPGAIARALHRAGRPELATPYSTIAREMYRRAS